MNRVDILFNAKLNVDKLEEQLSGIKKQTVEVGVDSSSMKEFKEVENTVKDIKKQYEDLSKKKLDMKTFEKSMAKVDQQFKDLNNKLGSLADQFANIAKNMPSEKVINLVNSFADATAEAKELANQATIIKDTINSTAKKAYKNTLINGDDSEELERIVGKLRELQAIIGGRKKLDLGVKNNGDDVKYIKDIITNIETLKKEYDDLIKKRDKFESSGKDTISDEFVDLQKNVATTTRKILNLTTELKNFKKSIDLSDIKISKGKSKGMDLSEIREDMIIELEDMEEVSKTYARSINNNLKLINAKPVGKNKKNENANKDQNRSGKPIGVPLYISTGARALQKQIDKVVDVVQANTSKTPIQVTISLISDFKSNKYKKELEKLHKDVDKIGDDGLRESFEKLTSQITSDLTYNIKTDILNAEIELRKAINRIKRELNKNRLPVSPKIEITEKKQKSIQRQLDNLAKTITLNINKIDISEKAIQEAMGNKKGKNKLIDAKSIADTAALANIIDKIIASNKEFMGTNRGVAKSLKEIKDLMNAMPTNEIVEPIKELVSIAQNLTSIIPKTDLDTVFDGMKKDVEEITGSLRNKENLKAIKVILQEYEKYVSMGGTKSIAELGGAKNVQNWFKNHYNPTDGQEFGNQYAKGIEESKPQVKNAAEEMVQTAIDATADTQDSHSPARVADQLGQYWGKGYANGILKTEGEVKDAIRALYEKGKLSFEEIENDRDIHAMISSSVADDIMYDEDASEQAKKFMNIIDILDEYSKKSKEANLNSVKGLPEDVRRTLTNVATKNLEDIRNGSIDASQAVERLAKAFEEVNENMAKMDADSTSDKIVENVEKEVKAEEKKKEVKKETKKTSEETVEVQKQEQKVVEKVGQTYQKVKDDVEEISDEMQEAFTKMEHDAIDNIAKSDDDHTMKVLSKYKALPDNAFKGLDKISRGKDEEKAKLANELLDLYGEYNNNPNKTTLNKIYTKTDRSNLSDKMKHSITNYLIKIAEEVNRGAVEAVDEAPKTFDKPKTKLISMSKGEYKEFVKNNHLIPMGNSASDFENNFKQHLKGLEEKGLTRSKYDKNGRLRRMQIAVEVLDQDAIDKTEEKVDNVEKKTEEVKTATKEVKEEVANVNKELDKAAEKSNEFTKSIEESAKSVNDIDPEKDLADYNKDISNYVDELMEELNIDDKPIVSNENTEESVSNINKIEDSFKELQEWSSKWIVAGGKNKNYKDGAKKLAAQYAKYKEQGGTQDVEALDKRVTVVRAVRAELEKMSQIESGGNRPISELSDNATVVKNLTEEYEKQIKTIKEDAIAIEDLAKAEKEMIDGISQSDNNVLGINVEEEIKNQNKFQEELKETEQIIKDNHSTSNESSILSDNDEVQKFLASVELLKDSKVYQGIYNVEDNIEGLVDSIKANLMSASEAIEQFVKLSSYDADTENKFKQLQQWSSTNVVASGKNKNLSEQASKLAKQYATYKSIGGIEPLEALDSRKTVIEAVRKEYEKNAQVVNQTAQEEIQAENKIQEELKETQQIIKDNHNTSNESDISSGTESKIQDTKKELLDFYNKLPSVNNAVMDQLDDSINQLEQQIKSGELSAEQALDRLDKKVFEVIESMHEFEKIDLNTSFTHIGSSELNKDKYNNIINSKNPSTINKPSGGFWASPSDNDEWEYIAEEEMGKSAEYLAERFTFKFKENAKVLIIKSLKDIENLPRIESYLDSEGKENTSGRDSQGNILPDWEKISKYYDGILVKINESEDDLYNALYGWDIDSVVVTNPDAIEQIKEETQSVIEDTEAQKKLSEVKKEAIKEDNNKSNISSNDIDQDKENIKELINIIQSSKTSTRDFFDGLINGSIELDEKLLSLLQKIGLIRDGKIDQSKIISNGNNNLGGFVTDKYTLIHRDKSSDFSGGSQELIKLLDKAYQAGLPVAKILDIIKGNEREIFEIQETMPGSPLFNKGIFNTDALSLSNEQLKEFLINLQKIHDLGLLTDENMSNFMVNKSGIGFIDQQGIGEWSPIDEQADYQLINYISDFLFDLTSRIEEKSKEEQNKIKAFVQKIESVVKSQGLWNTKDLDEYDLSTLFDFNKFYNETPISSETKKETSKKKSSKKNENKETALTVNDTKIASTATESAEAVKKEAEALEQVENTAKNASKAKDSFAKSNKKVDDSAKSSSKSIKEESDSLKDVNKAADKKPKSTYNKEIGYLKQRNKLEQEIAKTPNDNINNAPKTERIVQLDEKINALRAERKKLNAEDIEQQTKIDDLLEEHQFKLNQINQQLVQREVNDKKNAIDKNIGSIDKMLISTRYTDSYKEKLSELKNSLLDFKDVLASTDGGDIDKISEDFERLQVEITQTVDVAKQLDINKVINVDAIEKLGVKIANFGDQNTAMGKKFRSQLDEIQKKWEEFKISDNADVNRASLKALNDQFLELERSVSLAGKTGDSFVVGIGKRIKSVTQSAIAMSFSFYDVIRYARELGEVVLQTDTALTELRKVSDAPTARLQQSFEESANTARELGATITDVINATSDWARMGWPLRA